MANPDAGYPKVAGSGDGSVITCQWVLTSADPKGLGIAIPEWMDRTWHFKGTIGTAHATVETAPTDTDADYAGCKNAAGGAAIDITVLPAVVTNIEHCMYSRPNLVTAGAGATVTAFLIARRGHGLRS